MEKLLDLFLSNDIEDSKYIRAFSVLCNLILTEWLYTTLVGNYTLIDLKNPQEIIEFVLSGQVLIVVIGYSITLFGGYLFTMIGIIWYSFFRYPKKEYQLLSVKPEDRASNKDLQKSINLLQALIFLFKQMGLLIELEKNKFFINDDNFAEHVEDYFSQPKYLVYNILKTIKVLFTFFLAYTIISHSLAIPVAINIFIYLIVITITGFLIGLIFPLTALEVLAPELENYIVIEKDENSL